MPIAAQAEPIQPFVHLLGTGSKRVSDQTRGASWHQPCRFQAVIGLARVAGRSMKGLRHENHQTLTGVGSYRGVCRNKTRPAWIGSVTVAH